MTGQSLWAYMKDELYRCEGVIALVNWPNGPPDSGYEWEYEQPAETGTGANQAMGHAVTMVGFDDSQAANEFMYVNAPGNNKNQVYVAPPLPGAGLRIGPGSRARGPGSGSAF